MNQKGNAPASKEAEGAVCLLAGDTNANIIAPLQTQFLACRGNIFRHRGSFRCPTIRGGTAIKAFARYDRVEAADVGF